MDPTFENHCSRVTGAVLVSLSVLKFSQCVVVAGPLVPGGALRIHNLETR